MSPGQWVLLSLIVIVVSFAVGAFIEFFIGTELKRTKEEIDADVEDMLNQANNESADRVRAGTTNF